MADAEQMSAWIDRWNGKRDIYFTVNPTLGPLTKKASRKDIKEVEYLHVDIDPRAGATSCRHKISTLSTIFGTVAGNRIARFEHHPRYRVSAPGH